MINYESYSKKQLIQKINSLENENSFLKDFIRSTKEYKDFNNWIKNGFSEVKNDN